MVRAFALLLVFSCSGLGYGLSRWLLGGGTPQIEVAEMARSLEHLDRRAVQNPPAPSAERDPAELETANRLARALEEMSADKRAGLGMRGDALPEMQAPSDAPTEVERYVAGLSMGAEIEHLVRTSHADPDSKTRAYRRLLNEGPIALSEVAEVLERMPLEYAGPRQELNQFIERAARERPDLGSIAKRVHEREALRAPTGGEEAVGAHQIGAFIRFSQLEQQPAERRRVWEALIRAGPSADVLGKLRELEPLTRSPASQ